MSFQHQLQRRSSSTVAGARFLPVPGRTRQQCSAIRSIIRAPAVQRVLDGRTPEDGVADRTSAREHGDGPADAGLSRVDTSIQRAVQSGGNALAPAARAYMEPRFGADFSSVRVHTDARGDRLSRSLAAKAFTLGNHIFFRQGTYQPGSDAGRRLLAHELTHTVQQRSSDRSGVQKIRRQTQPRIMRAPCTAWNSYDASRTIDGPSGYNCAGLALRNYRKISPISAVETAIFNEGGVSQPCGTCGAGQVNYWTWTYTLALHEDTGHGLVRYYQDDDFHIVAGTDPNSVYSKNGGRPVYGPASGASWRPPARERATSSDRHETPATRNGNPVIKTRTGFVANCGCFDCL